MFKMTALLNGEENMTLTLAGSVNAESVPEIDRLIRDGRDMQKHVVLDLSEVTLIDRVAARFFARQLRHGIELADCPNYLKHWISREHPGENEK